MSEQLQAVTGGPGGPGRPGHPELEELAALIDGRCRAVEAARIRAHLASCAECYEVFSETLHLQEELRKDEEPAWGLDPFPFETRPKVWPRWVALAAAAAVVLGVGGGLWRILNPTPDLSVVALVAPLAGRAPSLGKFAWNEVKRGGGESEKIPSEELAVRAGVAVLNLQVALASNNQETADSAAAQVCSVLGISREQNQPNGALKSSQLDYTDPGTVFFYGNLRGRFAKSAPAALADEAARQAEILRPSLEENYFDLGKWAEAGRFAAIARKPSSLQSGQARFLLMQLRGEKDADVPPSVAKAIEAVEKLPADNFGALQSTFEQILNHYYPQGNPSGF
jgi:hypothetical protein